VNKDLAIRQEQSVALGPEDVVANASLQARLLMDIVDKTKCYQVINDKKYLQVEAWETIGAFNCVHAATDWVSPIIRSGETVGYDAKVSLVGRDGMMMGSAIMSCYFTENACKGKTGDAKDKACKSAAQTFATSKAYRMNYSYIAILAGYQPLPAEEITEDMKTEAIDKTQHWCPIHTVPFFKRGTMKNWAHKNDDGTWCNEPKKAEQQAPPPHTSQAERLPNQAEPDEEPPKETATLGSEEMPTVAKFREQIRGMMLDRFGNDRIKALALLEPFGVKKLNDIPDNQLPEVYEALANLEEPAQT